MSPHGTAGPQDQTSPNSGISVNGPNPYHCQILLRSNKRDIRCRKFLLLENLAKVHKIPEQMSIHQIP